MEIELADTVLESLRLAVRDWETPYKTLPDTELASGKLAFAFFTEGLRRGDYDERGAVILEDYVYTRGEIADYLQDVRHAMPGLKEPATLYAKCAASSRPSKIVGRQDRTASASIPPASPHYAT